MLSQEEMKNLKLLLKGYDDLYEKIQKDQKDLEALIVQIEKHKQNRLEGLKKAKKKGIRIGRPQINLMKNINFVAISELYEKHEISSRQAAKLLDVSQSTFLKYYMKGKKEDRIC